MCSPEMAAFSIKDFSNDCMDRKQNMAMLLHRMKQLNELDHTDFSMKYWYNPLAWGETEQETTARYAKDAREKAKIAKYKQYLDSPAGERESGQYENGREREEQRFKENATARY